MQPAYLYDVIFAPQVEKFTVQRRFWLGLSLMVSAVFAGIALYQAFRGDYIVQDDARQHVFWMQRFIDPALFPNDRIADYFQTMAPWGYSTLYRLFAWLWFSPWWLNKLLPMVLGLITTGYCFQIAMRLLPVPMTAFLATLLLNQSIWMKDDLVSGTPRAFVYPLFLAVVYYMLSEALIACMVAIALLGLFYPQYVLVVAVLLVVRLFRWQPYPTDQSRRGRSRVPIAISQSQSDRMFTIWTLGTAIVVLAFYALTSSEFDPVVTAASVRDWPEFSPTGRNAFFDDNPIQFFLLNNRSGLLNVGLVRPATLLFALLLPVLMRFPRRFILVRRITPDLRILSDSLIASILLFGLAHATLFKLHLPSRYTEHTWRIVFALAAAIALSLIFEVLLRQMVHSSDTGARLNYGAIALAGILAAGVIVYPAFVDDFPTTKYKQGEYPDLYAYLQDQPKDTIVASLSEEADNIPSFSQRSVLVAREYAIPYHWGYYEPFRKAVNSLIQAQYTSDLSIASKFIQTYNISFWLLDRDAFRDTYPQDSWFNQYPETTDYATRQLKADMVPAIESLSEQCAVLREKNLTLLDANCILLAAGETIQGSEPEDSESDADESTDTTAEETPASEEPSP